MEFCIISVSLIWSKTLLELIFNPCGEFLWSPESTPHLHVGAPGIFTDLLRSVQMLLREWGTESNGKLLHLFIPSKTAFVVPEFAMEDLPLSRTAALVPEFAVKALGQNTLMMMMMTFIVMLTYQRYILVMLMC